MNTYHGSLFASLVDILVSVSVSPPNFAFLLQSFLVFSSGDLVTVTSWHCACLTTSQTLFLPRMLQKPSHWNPMHLSPLSWVTGLPCFAGCWLSRIVSLALTHLSHGTGSGFSSPHPSARHGFLQSATDFLIPSFCSYWPSNMSTVTKILHLPCIQSHSNNPCARLNTGLLIGGFKAMKRHIDY